MSRMLIFVLFILASFTTAHALQAKCALEPYRIEGTLIEEDSGKPVVNANILVFFDNYEGTWSNGYETKYPDYFTVDSSGRFVATAFFNGYSGRGFFGGDRCNATPETITLVIIAKDYLSRRAEFQTKRLKMTGKEFNRTIVIPSIEMRLSLKP